MREELLVLYEMMFGFEPVSLDEDELAARYRTGYKDATDYWRDRIEEILEAYDGE